MNYYLRKFLKKIKLAIVSECDIDKKERKVIIKNALANKKRIALYICDGFGDTERYRCKNVMEAALNSNKWQAIYFDLSEYNSIKEFIGKIDLLVFARLPFSKRAMELVQVARNNGIKTVYDIDDLICNKKWLSELLKELNIMTDEEKKYWRDFVEDYEKMALTADGFITTNSFLAEKLKQGFKKPVQVIPNSLNREQIEVSEKCLENKKKNDGAEFLIGYFSGSPTHANDFKMVEPELMRFLEKYENVKLRVVGYMDFSTQIKKMIDRGRVEVMKPVDYLILQKLVSEVDVNIAPLVVNDFTNCKSELKFFEAAAVETTTIASPTYTFKKAIKDGENGFLAQPGEWYEKLEYLYKNPKKNREVALAAKEYALKHYYGKEFLKEVEAAYDYFAK